MIGNLVDSAYRAYDLERKSLQEQLDRLPEIETKWLIRGRDPDGSDFEAWLTVFGSKTYNLQVPPWPGLHMGRTILYSEKSPSALERALQGYTELTWDRVQDDLYERDVRRASCRRASVRRNSRRR